MKSSFTNLTGAAEIGANCYLIRHGDTSVILDAGMHPKKIGNAAKPHFDLIPDSSAPPSVFISHAHLDHIGSLPLLQQKFPGAEVCMTQGTADIGAAMLHNSVNVMTSQRLTDGITEYPFFTHGELERARLHWQTRPYEQPFTAADGHILATFYDAGHILGSCGVLLEMRDGLRIFYTGDVQFEDQSLIPGASFPSEDVDVLMMECTHGATAPAAGYTRRRELDRFASVIRRILADGGGVLIPVFALGKSQELLYELGNMRKSAAIPPVPVYFGGLGAKISAIYDRLADCTPRIRPGLRLAEWLDTAAIPHREQATLSFSAGNIYLVSGGMMSPHTLSNALAAQILPQTHHAVLFVGYCDPDSPAARLKHSRPGDVVRLGPSPTSGQAYRRACRTDCFDFSGHASRDALLAYARRLNPKQIILIHGDADARLQMHDLLHRAMPGADIIAPEPGVPVQLPGSCGMS